MGYRAFRGHAELDVDNIRAFAICDGCGALYNHDMLDWQTRWAGPNLVNTGKLVCPGCLDVPNPTFKSIVLPPDPEVVLNARPPKWGDIFTFRITEDGVMRATESGDLRITEESLGYQLIATSIGIFGIASDGAFLLTYGGDFITLEA